MIVLMCAFENYPSDERDSSVVECQTHNRESPGSNPPFAIVSKFGHFHSLHDASVDASV